MEETLRSSFNVTSIETVADSYRLVFDSEKAGLQNVIVKTYNSSELLADKYILASQNPCLVPIVGQKAGLETSTGQKGLVMVVEKDSMTLQDFISKSADDLLYAGDQTQQRQRITHLLLQLSWAIQALIASGVCHLRLSPNRIYVRSSGDSAAANLNKSFGPVLEIKVADFGISKYQKPASTDDVYLSPELLDLPDSEPEFLPAEAFSADVYAIGLIGLELLAGSPLGAQLRSEGIEATLSAIRGETRVAVSEEDSLVSLLVQCVHSQPQNRPFIDTVCSKLQSLLQSNLDGGVDGLVGTQPSHTNAKSLEAERSMLELRATLLGEDSKEAAYSRCLVLMHTDQPIAAQVGYKEAIKPFQDGRINDPSFLINVHGTVFPSITQFATDNQEKAAGQAVVESMKAVAATNSIQPLSLVSSLIVQAAWHSRDQSWAAAMKCLDDGLSVLRDYYAKFLAAADSEDISDLVYLPTVRVLLGYKAVFAIYSGDAQGIRTFENLMEKNSLNSGSPYTGLTDLMAEYAAAILTREQRSNDSMRVLNDCLSFVTTTSGAVSGDVVNCLTALGQMYDLKFTESVQMLLMQKQQEAMETGQPPEPMQPSDLANEHSTNEIESLKKAYSAAVEVYPVHSPTVFAIQISLAEIYNKIGEKQKALELFDSALESVEIACGQSSSKFIELLKSKISILVETKETTKADVLAGLRDRLAMEKYAADEPIKMAKVLVEDFALRSSGYSHVLLRQILSIVMVQFPLEAGTGAPMSRNPITEEGIQLLSSFLMVGQNSLAIIKRVLVRILTYFPTATEKTIPLALQSLQELAMFFAQQGGIPQCKQVCLCGIRMIERIADPNLRMAADEPLAMFAQTQAGAIEQENIFREQLRAGLEVSPYSAGEKEQIQQTLPTLMQLVGEAHQLGFSYLAKFDDSSRPRSTVGGPYSDVADMLSKFYLTMANTFVDDRDAAPIAFAGLRSSVMSWKHSSDLWQDYVATLAKNFDADLENLLKEPVRKMTKQALSLFMEEKKLWPKNKTLAVSTTFALPLPRAWRLDGKMWKDDKSGAMNLVWRIPSQENLYLVVSRAPVALLNRPLDRIPALRGHSSQTQILARREVRQSENCALVHVLEYISTPAFSGASASSAESALSLDLMAPAAVAAERLDKSLVETLDAAEKDFKILLKEWEGEMETVKLLGNKFFVGCPKEWHSEVTKAETSALSMVMFDTSHVSKKLATIFVDIRQNTTPPKVDLNVLVKQRQAIHAEKKITAQYTDGTTLGGVPANMCSWEEQEIFVLDAVSVNQISTFERCAVVDDYVVVLRAVCASQDKFLYEPVFNKVFNSFSDASKIVFQPKQVTVTAAPVKPQAVAASAPTTPVVTTPTITTTTPVVKVVEPAKPVATTPTVEKPATTPTATAASATEAPKGDDMPRFVRKSERGTRTTRSRSQPATRTKQAEESGEAEEKEEGKAGSSTRGLLLAGIAAVAVAAGGLFFVSKNKK